LHPALWRYLALSLTTAVPTVNWIPTVPFFFRGLVVIANVLDWPRFSSAIEQRMAVPLNVHPPDALTTRCPPNVRPEILMLSTGCGPVLATVSRYVVRLRALPPMVTSAGGLASAFSSSAVPLKVFWPPGSVPFSADCQNVCFCHALGSSPGSAPQRAIQSGLALNAVLSPVQVRHQFVVV